MIGKVVRMLVGRSMARKRGYSGAAGAAIGLIAPIVLKRAGKAVAKRRAVRRERKLEQQAPKYIGSVTENISQKG